MRRIARERGRDGLRQCEEARPAGIRKRLGRREPRFRLAESDAPEVDDPFYAGEPFQEAGEIPGVSAPYPAAILRKFRVIVSRPNQMNRPPG